MRAYFDSDYDIRSMLRALFHADFFKADDIRYEKVKSPAEFMAGVLRLTGEFDRPRREILDRAFQMTWMGQQLNNPPSVEGWHEGMAWIDTGTLVERINFASEQFGDVSKPGVKTMIDNVLADNGDISSGEHLVDACLDQMGVISVSDQTRDILMQVASQEGDLSKDEQARGTVANLFRLTAASHEFQRA